MSTKEEYLTHLDSLVASINEAVDSCFELSDKMLGDREASERVDRSIVLLESIEDLRGINDRLRLMRYRIGAE